MTFNELFSEFHLTPTERELLVHHLASLRVRRTVETLLPRKYVQFPTMLRKMWSGGEVQAWLDEHVNAGIAPQEPSP